MTFNSLGLNETLLQAVAESGYTTPTPIQLKAIPAILSGQDVMAAAQTGTGKTAGFTLPLLQLLGKGRKSRDRQVRALVLTPTRELAMQVQENVVNYGKYENLSSQMICGGININPQRRKLLDGCDILVATPGRLLDLYNQKAVRFDELEVLILDEADRMLDMGFIRDIRKLIALMPKQRQNLMFSATFSDEIRELARGICPKAVEIDAAPRNSTVQRISQQIYMTRKEHKLPLLATLLKGTADQVLVFSRTKHGANNMVKKLKAFSVRAAAIHGNKSQAQRVKALNDFKENRVQVLIATDIAARGIDIDQLSMVINFDLPQVAEDYVHRIGRTGRAGASGLAVSLVTADENHLLKAIERVTKQKIERVSYQEADLAQPMAADKLAELTAAENSEQQQRQGSQPGRQQNKRRSSAPRRGNQPRNAREAGSRDGETPRQEQAGSAQAKPAGAGRRRRTGQGQAAAGGRPGGQRRGEQPNGKARRGPQGVAARNNDRATPVDQSERVRQMEEGRKRNGNRQESSSADSGQSRGMWSSLKNLISTGI